MKLCKSDQELVHVLFACWPSLSMLGFPFKLLSTNQTGQVLERMALEDDAVIRLMHKCWPIRIKVLFSYSHEILDVTTG